MSGIMKAERIRVRILMPLVLMLGVLLALFIATFYWQQKEVMSDNLARLMQVLDQSIETQLQSDASKMSALIDMISPDQELKAAFLAQDRQGLLKLATPLLKRLGAEHQVTHLYFINPDRKMFLRAHRPGQHGDTGSRHTLLQAEETGEPASGIELGIHGGSLSLRAVMPWYDGEQLLGYIELGEDITHIIDKVHDLQEAEFYVTIYKEFLDRLHWEAGMRESGGKPDWEQFADSVVISNTLQAMPENIAEIQARHHYATLFKTGAEGRSYRIGFLPLFDAGERMVGDIAILYDVTGLLAGARTLFLSIGIIVFLLGGTVCVLFYFILGRVERQLALARKEKEALQASHITELEQKKAGLEQDKSELDAANREMNRALAEQHKVEQRFSDQANKSEQARQAMLYMLEDLNTSGAAIEHAKQEWEATFDAVSDPIFLHDGEFRIMRANRAYAEHAGQTMQEIIGKPYWQVFPMADGPLPGCLKALEKEEEEFTTADGRTFVSHSYAVRDEKASHAYSIHFMQDITERKRAEQTIRDSEERFRSVSETAQDAIIMLDNDGRISLWNRAAENMLGYSQGEVVGKKIHQLVIPEGLRKKHQQGYAAFRDTGQGPIVGKTVELAALNRDGTEFPIELSVSAAKAGGKWHAVGIMRNITERKQAENALAQSHDRLQESLEGTIQTIASAVEARDPYTAGHQRRVAELSVAIAYAMGLDEKKIEGIRWGSLIHDIGKINLPAEILSKPSKLTDIEYSLIQGHPQVGYDILKDIEFPWPVADIAYQHHERVDGSGYPQGLKGDEICLEARIVAVADVVEAMASHRPYRPSLGIDKALAEIKRGRGSSYDADMADACLKLFKENKFSFE